MERYFKKVSQTFDCDEEPSTSKKLRLSLQDSEPESDSSSSYDSTDSLSESDSEASEYEKKEEKKKLIYKQKIRKNWLHDKRFQNWLTVKDDHLTCKYCSCKLRPKLSGLIAHSKSKKHAEAISSFNNGKQLKVFLVADSKNNIKRACLQNAIHVACHTSICSVDHLTKLQKKVFSDSAIARDIQLGRTKCSALITNVLSPFFKKQLIADIGNNYFSLIIDESTDISVKKQLGIVIRYYSISSKQIINTFMKLVQLEDSTANGIVQAILQTLEEYKLCINNLKGLGTDNASTMVGVNKGVIALLKQHNPNIILVPCVCHSIQLAVSSASKSCIPGEVEYLICESYNWFSKSASRQYNYYKMFASINDGHEPLKLVRSCDTRWLSIETAVKRIAEQWIELKLHFSVASEKEKCHKAKTLRDLYTDTNLAYLIFLKPVLHEVQKVNKAFESNSADPTKLFSDLKSLIDTLCYQIVLLSNDFDPLSSPLQPFLTPVPRFSHSFEEFIKSKLSDGSINRNAEKIVRGNCQSFLIALIEQLRQRLPSNIDTLQKLNFLSVENTLRVVKPNIFDIFVNERFKYSADEVSMIEFQWRRLLSQNWINLASTVNFWTEVKDFKNSLGENPFRELVNFAFSFLVLPFSNAEVERIFSAMKQVKTKQRNKMKIKMLDSLLNIRCSLKRSKNCCFNYEIPDDLVRMLDSRDIYLNSSSPNLSGEEDIVTYEI